MSPHTLQRSTIPPVSMTEADIHHQREKQKNRVLAGKHRGEQEGAKWAYLLVNVPVNPQGLLAAVGWLYVADDTVVTWATGALLTSGNWKKVLGEGVPPPCSPLCFTAPISWKETPSGDEGCEWEEGDWVWYPLEGLPGLGLALLDEPAYKITPPGGTERCKNSVSRSSYRSAFTYTVRVGVQVLSNAPLWFSRLTWLTSTTAHKTLIVLGQQKSDLMNNLVKNL